jgi:hypothetical protein
MKQSSFFQNVSDIIIILFNVDDDHDKIDCDANKNSKTINDDVSDDDDDVRRKKKSTKIVF